MKDAWFTCAFLFCTKKSKIFLGLVLIRDSKNREKIYWRTSQKTHNKFWQIKYCYFFISSVIFVSFDSKIKLLDQKIHFFMGTKKNFFLTIKCYNDDPKLHHILLLSIYFEKKKNFLDEIPLNWIYKTSECHLSCERFTEQKINPKKFIKIIENWPRIL